MSGAAFPDRRGLTMIEMLLALALMSVVLVLAAGWTRLAADFGPHRADAPRWRVDAEHALRFVADDLACGDAPDSTRGDRVTIEGPHLIIRTRRSLDGRSAGPTEHRYAHRGADQTLIVTDRPGGAPDASRVLLTNVTRFTSSIDPETDALVVEIASEHGIAQRRYAR